MQNTVTICSTEYPVLCEVLSPAGDMVAVVDIPALDDVKWQRMALLQMLHDPDDYGSTLGGNVSEGVDDVTCWLLAHDPEYRVWFDAHAEDFAAFYRWRNAHTMAALEVTA